MPDRGKLSVGFLMVLFSSQLCSETANKESFLVLALEGPKAIYAVLLEAVLKFCVSQGWTWRFEINLQVYFKFSVVVHI